MKHEIRMSLALEADLHRFTVALLKKLRASVLSYHHPAGMRGDPRRKNIMKNMGARSGVADFIVIVGGKANYLELKKPGGQLSPDQLKFKADAELAGCRYMVADNENEVTEYLKAIGAM